MSVAQKYSMFWDFRDLIISFSKLLDQKALNVPSRQHIMDDEYYKKIEAIQFTMNHDDGNSVEDIEKSDIILLGVVEQAKHNLNLSCEQDEDKIYHW